MSEQQRRIKASLKRKLRDEAGGKCANPGCANWRSHFHHIKHWAVYKAHDSEHMIAICPSCHDAVHYGRMTITDEILYSWKGIERPPQPDWAHLFVEPAVRMVLALGSVCVSSSNEEQLIFELKNGSYLKIRLLDGSFLQVSTRLVNNKGREVLRVVENNVRLRRDKGIGFEFSAGMAKIEVPNTDQYLPKWAIKQMQQHYPEFAQDKALPALEIRVLAPGKVGLQGFWASTEGVVVAFRDGLSLCPLGRERPVTIVSGEGTTLVFSGDPKVPMFGFSQPA